MNPTRDVREKPRALAAVLFALCLLPMTTLALPPAVETDRLLLQAKTALDKADALSRDAASSNRDQALKEQYALAASAFEKAEALGTKLPSSVPYHHGVALAGIGKLAQARRAVAEQARDVRHADQGRISRSAARATAGRAGHAAQRSRPGTSRQLRCGGESARHRARAVRRTHAQPQTLFAGQGSQPVSAQPVPAETARA